MSIREIDECQFANAISISQIPKGRNLRASIVLSLK